MERSSARRVSHSLAVREALYRNDIRLGSWANELLDQVPLATEPRTVRLAAVQPSLLFPGRHVRLKTIYKEVAKLGGSPCPAEVGLVLHLQVATPACSIYAIAMEPMVNKDEVYTMFSVENGIGSSSRWLRGLEGNLNCIWNLYDDPHLDQIVVMIGS